MKRFLLSMSFIFILLHFSECLHREKRKIIFRKNSKMFLRLNGIQPFTKWNTIFRQGFGFRGNWDLPDTKEKYYALFENVRKRDVHDDIDELAKNPKTTDLICVVKYFTDMIGNLSFIDECSEGLFCNVARIINGHEGFETIFFRSILNKFKNVDVDCPKFDLVPVESPDLIYHHPDLQSMPYM